jgi:hypothetical protein
MGWSFGGTVGAPLDYATPDAGRDKLGEYREVKFRYTAPGTPFDGSGKTWVFSAADNFMTADSSRNASDAIVGGISTKIATLPAGFTHSCGLQARCQCGYDHQSGALRDCW